MRSEESGINSIADAIQVPGATGSATAESGTRLCQLQKSAATGSTRCEHLDSGGCRVRLFSLPPRSEEPSQSSSLSRGGEGSAGARSGYTPSILKPPGATGSASVESGTRLCQLQTPVPGVEEWRPTTAPGFSLAGPCLPAVGPATGWFRSAGVFPVPF